ncbi:DUF4234 domain-containing protein [Enterococcus columbae]|uniref:DUF4234 domain-containing protein n=1 Tax=Enterococcus columbae DSM 7374 = ATCC 51263 TaxID=1121865 RepID=S1N548_9ENTE|nr:DUF4234 domain-containing protein [Enterococcus columbae]EOT40369.1 hypothetical protein OMW_01623 [Enterococcus columbae DSM 7374 = ATCC 51263]EOW84107.1 hypothetical protein I568_01266 [Enterococcus columbae DSM 7374 = ATCC 51263]
MFTTKRNIVLSIIFSLITCGIYMLYWTVKLNDELVYINRDNETNPTSGIMVLLFSIITCGIYSIYWNYKMGVRCNQIKEDNGNLEIIFLLLSIFGLGIIPLCIMQDIENNSLDDLNF